MEINFWQIYNLHYGPKIDFLVRLKEKSCQIRAPYKMFRLEQRWPTRGPSTFSRNQKFRRKSTKSLKLSENLALIESFV